MFYEESRFSARRVLCLHFITKMKAVLSFTCIALLLSPVCSEFTESVGEFVRFGHTPDWVSDSTSSVLVEYICSSACRIGVEIVLSHPTRTEVVVYRRTWTNYKRFDQLKSRSVPLLFPPATLYRRDVFIRHPVDHVVLRAWLTHPGDTDECDNCFGVYAQSDVRTSTVLRTRPSSEHPAQPETRSVSWGMWLMWQISKEAPQKCLHESNTEDLLTYPFASSGKRFGVIHTFSLFKNVELETGRVHRLEQPRAVLSVWLYLLSWCSQSVCGIVRHVNEQKTYGSPVIMLSDSGDLLLQNQMVTGEDLVVTVQEALPLHTWIRLDFFFQVSKVNVTVAKLTPSGETTEMTTFLDFQHPIQYNDTSGYFVIGGCIYMKGIHGYFGPIKYYRLGSEKVTNPLSPIRTLVELDKHHRHCQEMRQATEQFLQVLKHNMEEDFSEDCSTYYKELRRMHSPKECTQTWLWDQQRKFNLSLRLLEENLDVLSEQKSPTPLLDLSQMIFQDAVKRLSGAEQSDHRHEVMPGVLELLQVSSCLGHHQSSLLLSTLHLAGLGIPVDLQQGHVYSLVGGTSNDRLALMHLGYKHMQGLDGFPKDQNVAYGYYANIGKQTSVDHNNPHDILQSLTEHVHLNNEEELHSQTGETGDSVQYLKFQAARGDPESQKSLARMLYWGSNGVEKDIPNAMAWYERGALQMADPTIMYDYAIFLLKGTGVKKNRTLGLKLLKKAADMGSVEALNGLGWYYNTIARDDRRAFRYFQLAAENGSCDGFFNIGIFHINGAHPDQPGSNETAAFEYFLRAAELGHVEGAVESAFMLSTGLVRGVKRDQEKAVKLLKQVSETNGYLGFMVKDGLQSYQKGAWEEALLKYAMLAETGLGVAQLNAAHLCEMLGHRSACHWRYHNISTYNHLPQEAGLLRMGDYYAEHNMVKALEMYSRAAVHNSPEGLFNLAVLTEAGLKVPGDILDQMHISAVVRKSQDAVVERLLTKCRRLEMGDVTPCSLLLWRIQLVQAWRDFTRDALQQFAACGIVVLLCVVMVSNLLKIFLAYSSSERNGETERGAQESRERALETLRPLGPIQQHQRFLFASTPFNQTLQESSEMMVTVTGVCVCFICTMFVSRLL